MLFFTQKIDDNTGIVDGNEQHLLRNEWDRLKIGARRHVDVRRVSFCRAESSAVPWFNASLSGSAK